MTLANLLLYSEMDLLEEDCSLPLTLAYNYNKFWKKKKASRANLSNIDTNINISPIIEQVNANTIESPTTCVDKDIKRHKDKDKDENILQNNNSTQDQINQDITATFKEYKLFEHEFYDINKTMNLISQTNTKLEKVQELSTLYEEIRNYSGCTEIREFANNIVISDGISLNPEIMLIGEAPGEAEDNSGIPFCGRSGALLDNIMESIGISRQKNCYITNAVFWRPPNNRRPTKDEILECQPFVQKHIALIQPKIIMMVGATALCSLFGNKYTMNDLRGQTIEYQNNFMEKPILATAIYHPSYLLRVPSKKKEMWYDLYRIQNFL